jgi:lipopolysaccharide transport system permease protein
VTGQVPSARPTGIEDVVTEVKPTRRRVRLSELWRSWPVAWVIAQRDLKVKYKQSLLGPLWLIFQPIGVLAGLVFVFNGVTKVNTGGVPYIIFGLAGISVWTFVQLSIATGTNVFVLNNFLIRRVALPRSSLFTAVILANLAPAAPIMLVVVVATAINRGLEPNIVFLPLILLWFIVLTSGVIFATASLTVRFRDVYALVPFWLQVGLFLTPVGYALNTAPSTLRAILSVNPLSGIFELWRWSLFGSSVQALPLVTAGVGTVVITALGWWLFTRMETRFADFI